MNKFYLLLLVWIGFLPEVYSQEMSLQEKLNRKQFQEILAEVNTLSAEDSVNFQKMYIIGQAYEGMFKYRDAYFYYQYCLRLDPLNPDLLNTLGRTAMNLGRVGDTEFYFNQVLQADSSNFYANYQLARLYAQTGEGEKAIDLYLFLNELDPDNSTLLRNLGDCYARMDDLPTASGYYYAAYNHNKENPLLASTLINTLLRVGGDATQEALSVCDTALFYNPDNIILQRNKGMALYMNRKYTEADTLYTALMEKGDSTYFTVKYGGSARYYAGYPMPAIEPLEKAYQMDTTAVDVCLLLGSALGKTYDRKRAFILLNKAEENMKPDRLLVNRLHLFRAETYKRDGKYPEASRLFYQVWKEDNKRLDLLYEILNMYSAQKAEQYDTEENRQRGLFINVLYTKEFLKTQEDPKQIAFQRRYFESFYEDMFFRSLKELPVMAPDGKRSKISAEELKQLIDRIPESQK